MGIYISTEKAAEIQKAAVDQASEAVKDYRQTGAHSIGYGSARIDITDGAKVEVITICFHPNRLKQFKCDILGKIYALLESEA
jgi:hypothetical protein